MFEKLLATDGALVVRVKQLLFLLLLLDLALLFVVDPHMLVQVFLSSKQAITVLARYLFGGLGAVSNVLRSFLILLGANSSSLRLTTRNF